MSTRRILQGNTILPIAGAKAYPETVAKLHEGDLLQIVPEPTNAYDANAMRIINSSCQTVGYLPAAIAGRVTREIGQVPLVARVSEVTTFEGVKVGARIKVCMILDRAA